MEGRDLGLLTLMQKQYANYTGFLWSMHNTGPRVYPAIVNDIQLFPKRCLLMELAHVGARTDRHHAYIQLRKVWEILCACAVYLYAPMVLHFSDFV